MYNLGQTEWSKGRREHGVGKRHLFFFLDYYFVA